jgi:aspartyl-tRNA synthetase
MRSHGCGTLGEEHEGIEVSLAGWVQATRMDTFILLRDRTGSCQVKADASSNLHRLPLESVVVLRGIVRCRPDEQVNSKMATGSIEVELTRVLEASPAKSSLPIQQSKHVGAKEALRMQYRYLDLRNPVLQRNLMLRSQITMAMRQFLVGKGFLDIETPTLFRRTPGGAKEFVVPTRLKGKFYSLVQSPQQFKQLLMVGGLDRYFQVARCYRDEGGKPDRQPEFTQLDLEISFAGREDILDLVEDLLAACLPSPPPLPLPRITYAEAMAKYGVDKPDTRYENAIQDLGPLFSGCGFDVMEGMSENNEYFVGGVFFDGQDLKSLKHVEKEVRQAFSNELEDHKTNKVPVVLSSLHTLDGQPVSSVLKKCKATTCTAVAEAVGSGRLGFLVACPRSLALTLLGRLRTALARHLLPDLSTRPHSLLWVVDFPMFLWEEGVLESAHHPFTAAHPDDQHLLKTDPLSCRSLHYDLVADGQEIGGGSVRIHREEEQRFILREVLGEEEEELEHLLTALGSGAPPHAGIALGLDRLLAIIARASSIRDVIAFPKSAEGRDLMAGAPATITKEQKLLYHLAEVS